MNPFDELRLFRSKERKPANTDKAMKLYDYLRQQFTDLDSCIKWCSKWYNEWDQDIPDHPEWAMTMRAMARHCSNVLEGRPVDEDGLCFLDTKYGPDLFFGMCGDC
jgi:hypothetical protein